MKGKNTKMKQLKDPKKLVFGIVTLIIIIAGIVMIAVKGFNVELRYTANKKVELIINQEIDINKEYKNNKRKIILLTIMISIFISFYLYFSLIGTNFKSSIDNYYEKINIYNIKTLFSAKLLSLFIPIIATPYNNFFKIIS